MDPSTADFTRQWTAALPKVAAFVGSMVYDVSDRDDAAMTSFERYDHARPFAGWAIGVARNQVRLYLRRKSSDPHIFDDDALDLLVEAFSRVKPDFEHQLTRLDECVSRLDDRARQICEYRYAHDMKPAAIAAELNMTPNTVAKSLQRIREQLKTCIETLPSIPS